MFGSQQFIVDDRRKADRNGGQVEVGFVVQFGVHDDRIPVIVANVRAYVHNAEDNADGEEKEVDEMKDRVAKKQFQQKFFD